MSSEKDTSSFFFPQWNIIVNFYVFGVSANLISFGLVFCGEVLNIFNNIFIGTLIL